MAPRRKKQRLSEEGAKAVTATVDVEQAASAPTNDRKSNARRQLFVRSLAKEVTTEALTEFFSDSYPIKNALVVLDKDTKESKGYGFVTFADVEDAQRALEELDGAKLQGKKIRLESAEARHREDGVEGKGQRLKAEREAQKKENQTPKLIVRNLPWSIKKPEDLEKHFRSFGKTHFINLPKKPNGELRGFAFVAMRGKKNAEKALAELNGKEIDGRPIAVDWAVDKDAWQTLQKTEQEGEEAEDKKDLDMEDANSDAESSEEPSDDESEEDGSEDDKDDSNTDYDDEDISDDEEGGVELEEPKPQRPNHVLFIRNLPFTVDDDSLKEHFQQFGAIRYARVVVDRDTERPKGTGFVAFFNEEEMINCLKGVPKVTLHTKNVERKDGATITTTHSVLEDADADPTGKYTMDGRILSLSRAVDKNEATRLTAEGAANRFNRDKDKRRLYLLNEGTIASNSPLYSQLAPSEVKMREDSATLRRKQIQENPSLHLSLTRLSVRNIPRSITSKDLKQLARKAVVGFAEDVNNGKRQRLSKAEIARGGEEMVIAEKIRKKRGKGIVRQAKVVFETEKGSKVGEETGAGRSRGYGFIEYYTHRNALMGLRWLNGHAVDYKVKGDAPKSKKAQNEALEDKRKRLIVEFAIENANVVSRRSAAEEKSREPKPDKVEVESAAEDDTKTGKDKGQKRRRDSSSGAGRDAKKAKGRDGGSKALGSGAEGNKRPAAAEGDMDKAKLAQRTRIIAQKRMKRKANRAK
ncbi:RNA-binding domain-containing protein [Macroventuria anomochaeta]|uniref:RNA-binding domain-containing protein n=1 Tax=Macroventuria anomochaeta TaxID=301207 RepID=A0ACB6SAC0_9PLEO|nr:RNA-binding domain-containing protein [Macroventuria anomochaeta]KAF2630993.1 RNA-binding domain-containing protein [Macroventuria anomochaeta]